MFYVGPVLTAQNGEKGATQTPWWLMGVRRKSRGLAAICTCCSPMHPGHRAPLYFSRICFANGCYENASMHQSSKTCVTIVPYSPSRLHRRADSMLSAPARITITTYIIAKLHDQPLVQTRLKCASCAFSCFYLFSTSASRSFLYTYKWLWSLRKGAWMLKSDRTANFCR